MIRRFFRGIYVFSLDKLVAYARRHWGMPGPRIHPPGREFLTSPKYQAIMNRFVPATGDYGIHEAQAYTRSYINRHNKHLSQLGVFRWRGFQEHLDDVLPLVSDPNKYVVDFGGAGCPLGFNSVVVDFLKKDAAGRPVKHRTLSELPRQADVMFAAHVLEHVPNLDEVLAEMKAKTVPGGPVIIMVPAYTNEGWHAGAHNNKRFGGHVWTFGLSRTQPPPELHNYRAIDETLARYVIVEKAEYVGDDCVYCFCRNSK